MRRTQLSVFPLLCTLTAAAACSLGPTVPSSPEASGSSAPSGSTAGNGSGTVSPDARTFTLVGDGSALQLKGAPANASYDASYPIKGFTAMTVSANAYGDLTATCQNGAGASTCSALPFFTQVGGSNVHVYDAYGKVVMAVPVTPDDAGTVPTPVAPIASADAGNGTGGGGGGAGSGATGATSGATACDPTVTASLSSCSLTIGSVTCDCCDPTCASNAILTCLGNAGVPGVGALADAGLPSSGSGLGFLDDAGFPGLSGIGALDDAGIPGLPGAGSSFDAGVPSLPGAGSGLGALGDAGSGSACSSSAIASAEAAFCAAVDSALSANGISATLDCATLGTLSFPATLPPASSSSMTCDQLTQSAFAQVRATLATCNPLDYIGWNSSAQLQLFDDGACTVW